MNQTIQVAELFESIQGETSSSGVPTTFVRLSGCPWRCLYCDSSHAYQGGETYTLIDLKRKVETFRHPYVCITGGEPLMQESVHPFISMLIDEKFQISVETGGAYSIAPLHPKVRVILDVKCPGSGHEKDNDFQNLKRLKPHDEVKFVLSHKIDYLFAKETCETHDLFKAPVSLLFSPVHGILDPKELVSWILQDNLNVRLNLQLHKYIWGSDVLGV